MKKLSLLVLMIAFAGCGEAARTETAVRARDASMEATTEKMVVTRGKDIPGHSQLVELGKVRGHCLANPEANDIIPAGDNLRQAAYRKYGSQVDGIVSANAFHVNDDFNPGAAADTATGHFECEGTAVHFQQAASN